MALFCWGSFGCHRENAERFSLAISSSRPARIRRVCLLNAIVLAALQIGKLNENCSQMATTKKATTTTMRAQQYTQY